MFLLKLKLRNPLPISPIAMAGISTKSVESKKYAVVTGGNKGIGLEICRQLASQGVSVVLTARNEKRGIEAVEKLKKSGLSDNVMFHQLDVTDTPSVDSLAGFIKSKIGKLDILVNNAGVNELRDSETGGSKSRKTEYDLAVECLQINYYGLKRTTEGLLPLLQLSESPRIVNVSSTMKSVGSNKWAKGILNDIGNLTEEKIDQVLNEYLKDFKEGSLSRKGWPTGWGAYCVSKAAVTAYTQLLAKRYAVVTGANKGIGFEICKQLASKGIIVILTARNEKRGIEAQERLKEFEFSNNIIFHQLDVVDPASVASIVDFLKIEFGKLDILVNNAGVSGFEVEGDVLVLQELILKGVASISDGGEPQRIQPKANGTVIETLKSAKDCLQTNYFGVKRITEALIPLLQLSDSPRIVNVSSMLGNLKLMSNEWAKGVLSNEESLTEEKIDEVVQNYLKSFEEGSLEANRWPTQLSAYKVSKVSLNAYTRFLAKKYPNFRINCLCPGFTRTDITCNLGPLSTEEAAEGPVKLALLPNEGSSGLFFSQKEISHF